jgi:hypothetical protein
MTWRHQEAGPVKSADGVKNREHDVVIEDRGNAVDVRNAVSKLDPILDDVPGSDSAAAVANRANVVEALGPVLDQRLVQEAALAG